MLSTIISHRLFVADTNSKTNKRAKQLLFITCIHAVFICLSVFNDCVDEHEASQPPQEREKEQKHYKLFMKPKKWINNKSTIGSKGKPLAPRAYMALQSLTHKLLIQLSGELKVHNAFEYSNHQVLHMPAMRMQILLTILLTQMSWLLLVPSIGSAYISIMITKWTKWVTNFFSRMKYN